MSYISYNYDEILDLDDDIASKIYKEKFLDDNFIDDFLNYRLFDEFNLDYLNDILSLLKKIKQLSGDLSEIEDKLITLIGKLQDELYEVIPYDYDDLIEVEDENLDEFKITENDENLSIFINKINQVFNDYKKNKVDEKVIYMRSIYIVQILIRSGFYKLNIEDLNNNDLFRNYVEEQKENYFMALNETFSSRGIIFTDGSNLAIDGNHDHRKILNHEKWDDYEVLTYHIDYDNKLEVSLRLLSKKIYNYQLETMEEILKNMDDGGDTITLYLLMYNEKKELVQTRTTIYSARNLKTTIETIFYV